jgi:hypothetical protein
MMCSPALLPMMSLWAPAVVPVSLWVGVLVRGPGLGSDIPVWAFAPVIEASPNAVARTLPPASTSVMVAEPGRTDFGWRLAAAVTL